MSHRALGGQFDRLFHGTSEHFEPDDVIEPMSADVWEDDDEENPEFAFATSDPANAQSYAEQSANLWLSKQKTPRVYHVEPQDNWDNDNVRGNEYRSGTGYRVVREIPQPVIKRYMGMRFQGRQPDWDELSGFNN